MGCGGQVLHRIWHTKLHQIFTMKNQKINLPIVLIFILISQIIKAQNDFNVLSRWAYGLQEEMLFHPENNQIGYLSSGANLVIADFTDPLDPVEINTITVNKFIDHFILADDHLYIIDRDILWLYEITNMTDPDFVQSLVLDEPARLLFFNDDHLYLVGDKELSVFDLKSRKSPSLLASIETEDYLFDLAFNGPYIYGSTQRHDKNWMVMIDVSDLEAPQISTFQFSDTYIYTVEMVDSYLYVGGRDSLYVLNVTTPDQPIVETTISTEFVFDISIQSNAAFISAQCTAPKIYDISDPSNPVFASRLKGCSRKMRFIPPLVYTFTESSIGVHEVSDIYEPQSQISEISFGGRNNDLEIENGYVYVVQSSQLVILDLNDPENPIKIASIPVEDGINLELDQSYVYVAQGSDGWSIVDVHNIMNPVAVNQLDRDGQIRDIKVMGDFAFLADERNGVRIYDISDPLNPQEKGTYAMEGDCKRLLFVDSYLYAFEEEFGLKVIDISDKTNPLLIDSIPYSRRIETMLQYDTLLYLGINTDSRVLNISDPAHPVDLGIQLAWSAPRDFFIESNTLYVTDWRNGLNAYDLSDPMHPELIAQFTQGYRADRVRVEGDIAYLLDAVGGLYVLEYDQSTPSVQVGGNEKHGLFTFYPNPVQHALNLQFSPNNENRAQITIYNIAGKILDHRDYQPESNEAQINVSEFPPGLYFFTVNNKHVSQTEKFIRVK